MNSESGGTDIFDITPIIVYQICSGYDCPETTSFVEDLTKVSFASASSYGRRGPTSINWGKSCKPTEHTEPEQSQHTLSYVDNLVHILGMGRSLSN